MRLYQRKCKGILQWFAPNWWSPRSVLGTACERARIAAPAACIWSIAAAKTGAPRRRTRVCLGTSRCVIGTAAGCGQSGVHLLATNVDREWACRLNVVPGAMSTSTDALLRSAS